MQNKNTDQALQTALKLKPDMTLAEFNKMQAQPLPTTQIVGHIPSKTRLIVGLGMIIITWVVAVVFSVIQIVYISDTYTNIINGGVSRTIASYQAQSEVRALRQVFTATVMHAHTTDEAERQMALNSLMADAQHIQTSLFFALEDYDISVITDPMQTQAWVQHRLEITHNLRHFADIISNHHFHVVFNYAIVGDYDRSSSALVESTPLFLSLMDEINFLIEMSEASVQQAFFHAHDTTNSTVVMITTISVIAVIGSIVVAIVLLRPKRNPEDDRW